MKPVRLLALLLFGVAVAGLVFLPQILQDLFPVNYSQQISAAEKDHGVDWALIAAVIQVESGFSPQVVSKKGAVGLMQIMPETAQWVGARLGEQVDREDLLDPEVNIHLGTITCATSWTASPARSWPWRPTTAARPTWPAGWRRASGTVPMRIPTAYPFAETRSYVRKVLMMRRLYRYIYPEGIQELEH